MRMKLATLLAAVFAGSMLAAPEVAAQPAGLYPNCEDGQFTYYRYYRSNYVVVNRNSWATITQSCPTNGCIISGGYESSNPNTTGYNVHYSYPTNNRSW